MMDGSDVMASFAIEDCSVTGTITGGDRCVDAVVGDLACAVSVDCENVGGRIRSSGLRHF